MATSPIPLDLVRETTATTGTGTLTLAGAQRGYQSFGALGDSHSAYCCVRSVDNNEWEVFLGTYTLSGTTLSRDTVLASSNGGQSVSLSAGTKHVYIVAPAGTTHPTLSDFGGRLTLTSGLAITTSDVTAATTLYYTPGDAVTGGQGMSNRLALWDGSCWRRHQIAEFAIPVVATLDAVYDVFAFESRAVPSSTNTGTDIITFGSATGCATGSLVRVTTTGGGLTAQTDYWWNAASSTTGSLHTTLANALAGTSKVDLTASITSLMTGISLEFSAAWASSTSRTDALAAKDGIRVKSADNKRVLLGKVRGSATNQLEDSALKRLACNEHNAVPRRMFTCPGRNDNSATTSYTSTSTTFTLANGGTGATLTFLTNPGVPTNLFLCAGHLHSVSYAYTAVGIDSTSSAEFAMFTNDPGGATGGVPASKTYSEGLHTAAILVRVSGGTGTFYADDARGGSSADPYLTFLEAHPYG